jgi:hypothetical protein
MVVFFPAVSATRFMTKRAFHCERCRAESRSSRAGTQALDDRRPDLRCDAPNCSHAVTVRRPSVSPIGAALDAKLQQPCQRKRGDRHHDIADRDVKCTSQYQIVGHRRSKQWGLNNCPLPSG